MSKWLFGPGLKLLRMLGRVLPCVLAQLVLHGLLHIRPRAVHKLQQVQQHVGHLITHTLFVGCIPGERVRPARWSTAEQLQQFRRLRHQRHGEILGQSGRAASCARRQSRATAVQAWMSMISQEE